MKQTLARTITILYKDFVAYTSAKLQELGLNYGSLPFILYVGKHPECTPSELREVLHMDWGYSQRSIVRLAEEGFMVREKHGRSYQLHLTEQGIKAFEVSHQVFEDWDDLRMEKLSDEEQQLIMSLLGKVKVQGRGQIHV